MKIFSFGGLVFFLIFYVVIDRALGFAGLEAYKSPFTAGMTAWSGQGSIETKATAIGGLLVFVAALVAVYFTPRIF